NRSRSADQLHCEKRQLQLAVRGAYRVKTAVINPDDVRVLQLGQFVNLIPEGSGVARAVVTEHQLDRDLSSPDIQLGGFVDDSHAAVAEVPVQGVPRGLRLPRSGVGGGVPRLRWQRHAGVGVGALQLQLQRHERNNFRVLPVREQAEQLFLARR